MGPGRLRDAQLWLEWLYLDTLGKWPTTLAGSVGRQSRREFNLFLKYDIVFSDPALKHDDHWRINTGGTYLVTSS